MNNSKEMSQLHKFRMYQAHQNMAATLRELKGRTLSPKELKRMKELEELVQASEVFVIKHNCSAY